MWCTQCKTAFSWRTGLELHERVHNPHFYEWQRKNGGGVAPRVEEYHLGPCEHITYAVLIRAIYNEEVRAFHQFSGHILATIPQPEEICNLGLRIDYLLGEINEDIFARKIQQRDKKKAKETEMRQIIEVFCQAVSDVFRKIVNQSVSEAQGFPKQIPNASTKGYLSEIREIVNFVNEQLDHVAKKYVSKRKQIVVDRRGENDVVVVLR